MRRLVSDRVHDVTEVRFEHSPGRGHPAYTADHTAFDVLIRCTTPHGHNAFVANSSGASSCSSPRCLSAAIITTAASS